MSSLEDIDSVSKNIPTIKISIPKGAEVLAAKGQYTLYACNDYPLAFQIWTHGTYCAGFTDETRALQYLKARL